MFGSSRANRDTERYLAHYPGMKDNLNANKNIQFYNNEIVSVPKGAKIETIHQSWWGDHDLLEDHHGYIQWLFPIREDGMNMQAQSLQLHESITIKSDPIMSQRVQKSHELMLHFYGMKLKNKDTGEITRDANYQSRYRHLNSSLHNALRITRILKSLGELGYEHYKIYFCLFILKEIRLGFFKRLQDSAINYWFPVLRNTTDRTLLQQCIQDKSIVVDDYTIHDLVVRARTSTSVTSTTPSDAVDTTTATTPTSSSSSTKRKDPTVVSSPQRDVKTARSESYDEEEDASASEESDSESEYSNPQTNMKNMNNRNQHQQNDNEHQEL